MKRKILICALILTLMVALVSCNNKDLPDSDTLHDTSADTSDTLSDTSAEDTESGETNPDETAEYMDEIIEKLPEDVDGSGLKYHEAAEGNLIIAYDDKNAWAFDLNQDKVVSLIDYDSMLAAADIGGRSGDYFSGENTLSLDFPRETENEVRIEFTVTSEDEKSEYVVYAFYRFGDEGGLGDYYYESITFPESGKGVTIIDVEDYKKLAVEEDNSLFRFAKAIIENDVPTLEKLCNVDAGVLDVWEGMEIADYSITRSEFGMFLEELYLRVNVTKSDVEKLPVGNNVIVIKEGMMNSEVEFLNADNDAEETIDNEAVMWIESWIDAYGFNDPQWVVLEPEEYMHAMLDFFIGKYEGNISDSNAEEFAEFCEDHFYFPPIEVEDSYVNTHGGHGLPLRYYKITKVFGSAGYYVITVDYYADPMGTVVAYTHEFTLIENEDGTFKLNKTERTYDSGLKSYGWTS